MEIEHLKNVLEEEFPHARVYIHEDKLVAESIYFSSLGRYICMLCGDLMNDRTGMYKNPDGHWVMLDKDEKTETKEEVHTCDCVGKEKPMLTRIHRKIESQTVDILQKYDEHVSEQVSVRDIAKESIFGGK